MSHTVITELENWPSQGGDGDRRNWPATAKTKLEEMRRNYSQRWMQVEGGRGNCRGCLSREPLARHLSLEKQFEVLEQSSFCLIVAEPSREICFLTEVC